MSYVIRLLIVIALLSLLPACAGAIPLPPPPPTPTPLHQATDTPDTLRERQPGPTPAPTATPSPTSTPSPSHTPAPEPTATETPTLTPTPQPTLPPTSTSEPTASLSPTPTLTRTPTASPTSTPKPTASATPTLPSETDGYPGVLILSNHSAFVDTLLEVVHIVGEVYNLTEENISVLDISAHLLEENGKVVATTATGYTGIDVLAPGNKTCFNLEADEAASWSSYEFDVLKYETIDLTPAPGLQILNEQATYDPATGWYRITGQVRNGLDARVEYVFVAATLYDAHGTVIGCEFAFVEGTHLDPGEADSFEILFSSRDEYSDTASYRLQIDGFAPEVSQRVEIPGDAVEVQFLKVVDGDTIEVLLNGRREKVRYIGIDAPEIGHPGYWAATEANRKLLGTGPIYLMPDQTDRDRFGRLLRYVYAADGTFVNAAMIAQGWAQPVEYPPDTRHADEFRALAQEAAAADRGFWSGSSDYDGAMSYGTVTARAVNIRRGPGTNFAIVGVATAGMPLTIFGRNPAGDWLQIRAPDRTGGWMYAPLVQVNVPIESIPVATEIPTPPVMSTATPVPPPAPASVGNVVIHFVLFNGAVRRVESDEYVEILNRGSTPVNLAGWHLNAGDPGQDFVFPEFILQPGRSCRVYTNEYHPESCGFSFGIGRAIWNHKGDCGYLFDSTGTLVSEYCY